MGTTPTFAWPYPELTDPPDGAGQIKALALAAETTVDKRTADTGFITVTVNYGAGWMTNGNCRGRRRGDICYVWLTAKYTGATVTANARGECGDLLIATVTDTRFLPGGDPIIGMFYNSFAAPGGASFLNNGAWNLNTLGYNAATLLANDLVISTFTYMAANPLP